MFETYLQYEYHFAAAQLLFVMLGMGATLGVRDFLDVFREPTAFFVGIGTQLVAAPLVALLVGVWLDPPAGLGLGLILLAAVPGGTMSNLATWLARGNVPLSISLTAVTTLGSLVMTPFLLELLMGSQLPTGFVMPAGRVAFDIAFILLGPLALGMVIGNAAPRHRLVFSRWCIYASFAMIGVIVVGSAGAGRIDASAFGWFGPGVIAIFSAAVQVAGVLPGLLLGLPRRDLVAIGVEVTIRNSNLALLLKASLFPAVPGVADPVADGVLFAVLLYGGIALPVALPLIVFGRTGQATPAAPSSRSTTPQRGSVSSGDSL
jgi:BASS family bile acid:Na+ symporter